MIQSLQEDGMGAIKYWSAEGDTIWGIETPNRISCLTIEADKLYATSGLHLLKIDLTTGNIDWQIQLEGSADAVRCYQKNASLRLLLSMISSTMISLNLQYGLFLLREKFSKRTEWMNGHGHSNYRN